MDVHPRAWYLLRKKNTVYRVTRGHSFSEFVFVGVLGTEGWKEKGTRQKGRKTAWNNNGARLSSDDRARDGFLCKWTSPTILKSHLNAPAQLQHMRAHTHGEHGHLRGNSCNWRTISLDARNSLWLIQFRYVFVITSGEQTVIYIPYYVENVDIFVKRFLKNPFSNKHKNWLLYRYLYIYNIGYVYVH